jgi:hypothetical protein
VCLSAIVVLSLVKLHRDRQARAEAERLKAENCGRWVEAVERATAARHRQTVEDIRERAAGYGVDVPREDVRSIVLAMVDRGDAYRYERGGVDLWRPGVGVYGPTSDDPDAQIPDDDIPAPPKGKGGAKVYGQCTGELPPP